MPDIKAATILHQSTLLVALDSHQTNASSGGRGRKRTLTLVNGGMKDREHILAPINPPSLR